MSTAAIAAEFDITQRTVQRAVKDFEAAPSPVDERPMQIVENTLRTYRRMRSDFEALAARYEITNPQAAIGAKRQARETLHDYLELLFDLGKLPDLDRVRAEGELYRLAMR